MSQSTNITDSKQLGKVFDNMMTNNADDAGEFYLSFTKNNVKEIEEIIYKRIPMATTAQKVDYHLDELVHELNKMKLNISARNKTVSAVFSEKDVKALRETHARYLLKISDAGKRASNANVEVLRGRVFGIWGDDIFAQVAAWEKQHGKMLDNVEDVEVRDMLYDWQELCRTVSC